MVKWYSTQYSDHPWLDSRPKSGISPEDDSSMDYWDKEERVLRPITPKANKVITPLLTAKPPLSIDEVVKELRSNGLRQGRDYTYSSSIPPKRYDMEYYEGYFLQELGRHKLTSQGIGIVRTSIKKQRSAKETLRLFIEGRHYVISSGAPKKRRKQKV